MGGKSYLANCDVLDRINSKRTPTVDFSVPHRQIVIAHVILLKENLAVIG